MTEFTLPPLPSSRPEILFPEPQALKFETEEKEEIETTIYDLWRAHVEDRKTWNQTHLDYDLSFRGQLEARGDEDGPWPNSSNLHIPIVYWLVQSYNTRLVSHVFSQVPQVMGHPTEDDDKEIARDSANLIKWHIQPKRMNLREAWTRMSKTRCIHGSGRSIVPWAKDEYVYRAAEEARLQRDEDGRIVTDEDGTPLKEDGKPVLKRETKYDGPVMIPLEWDDVIEPMEGINLQPVTAKNPLGAQWVGVRQWEPLSLIWKKKASSYPYIDETEGLKEREDWIDDQPSQDRSNSQVQAQERARQQDQTIGKTRNRSKKASQNPEFEILTWMMPWELENEKGEKEEAEVVFFFRTDPKALLGAFRLTDLQFRNKRPLIELDFQTVGNRRDSMGICEIVADLSAELDAIHNMRIDVGFATNMPFFFYQSTSTTDFSRIVLRPMKGIPVDDVRQVSFPQLQGVTTFYHQEEELLYSLFERVLGVTDLFLGVSPTRGAAARHATGFVGTQQEAMARAEDVMSSDSRAFSDVCHLIYEAELQFGPAERIIRLEGKEGPLSQKLSRRDLWFRGEYDFTLGGNFGLYSSQMRQQQAQMLQQMAPASMLIQQDPGRVWEVENEILLAYGFDNPEQFIGPKEAVSAGTSKSADEENGEMTQHVYGVGIPAPVHPSDNDPEHLQKHLEYVNSDAFRATGGNSLPAFMAHIQQTQAQMQRKQQMQMMQQVQAAQAPPQGQPGQPGGNGQPTAQNVASLGGTEQAGQMGQMPPPNFGEQ